MADQRAGASPRVGRPADPLVQGHHRGEGRDGDERQRPAHRAAEGACRDPRRPQRQGDRDRADLLLRGDAPPTSAAALAVVVVTLAFVTRILVLRASDAGSDALTGLANRRGFDEALDEHIRRPEDRLSAGLLDLDHFKQLNDSAGHAAGDHLLRRVADTWRKELPPGALLARHGGDEFALLLPGRSGAEALAVVRRLCALVPDVSVSAGVSEQAVGDTAAQLMRRADLALYQVKADGRGAAALHTATVSA